jgi:serine/threonine-protein kinase RsbW
VRDFARAHGLEGEPLEVVLLCVSEAATNAVVHAFVDREAGTLTVSAATAPDRLVVRVGDDGSGMRPRTDSPGLGLGLPTIGQLAAQLDLREGPDGGGTEVRMAFATPGLRGEEPAAVPDGRYELLAEVARLVEGQGWPETGVDRLVEILVPDVGDASAVDVVDDRGGPRRMAARITGDDADATTRWLLGLKPRTDAPGSATRASLRERRPRQVELTPDHVGRITRSPEDAERMEATGIRWWVVVPLIDGDRLLGLLHCGRRAERGPFSDATVDFLGTVAERAGRGLAHTRLMAELRRARRRFERVLGALTEAVLLHDAGGRVLFANQAAARLLGLRGAAEPGSGAGGSLATLRPLTREDGTPIEVGELPGPRLLAGGRAEPLLARTVDRATGEEQWLLTRAERLDDDLAVTIVEDVTGDRAAR